jgi:hypothetical protein
MIRADSMLTHDQGRLNVNTSSGQTQCSKYKAKQNLQEFYCE